MSVFLYVLQSNFFNYTYRKLYCKTLLTVEVKLKKKINYIKKLQYVDDIVSCEKFSFEENKN